MKNRIELIALLLLAPVLQSFAETDVRQQEVLDVFEEICKVPRYSSFEVRIGNWLTTWAATNGFASTRDTVGNVIIEVPATPGMENRELVVLQTHQDMVRAVKDGVQHSWETEPIVPVVEDGWIHSENFNTSLGADDGIGMATVLAVVQGDAPHGPLRLIMTVEEETTQVGVKQLDTNTVADAKYLINVDCLEEGVVTISSACADVPNSELLTICTNVYKTAFGKDISVIATHAGLECGAFKAKNPALDIISIGPTVLNEHSTSEKCDFDACLKVRNLLEGILLQIPERVVPLPVITFFKPDFTQGPTTQVPNVSWKIAGPFDRVALTIDKTTVYEGNDRNGEGRWRDLRSPGTHRLLLTVGYGDLEVTASCFYTALLEGDEPALMPMIGYFYPDYYVGKKGAAPLVHWDTMNITSFEIWLDGTCILVSQYASGEFRFSQLDTPGSYVVRMVAHNAIDDAEASFCYRCEAPVQDQLMSAPLPGSADQPPVIQTFEPDAYEASIRATPYIRWNISAPVDALKLVIDDIPVFIGDGSTGNGRWLDVSGLNLGELIGSHEVSLSVSNSFGVATSNFTCTCYWEDPPPPPKGCEENPWVIGEDVQAYTNGLGGLIVSGSGATSNYTDTATVPWTEVSATIKSVSVTDLVEVIGDNLWAGLAEDVVINGETIARRKVIAVGFPADTPAGAISPAEFERIDIVDGVAYLGVSVYTNSDVKVEGEGWGVATNGVIEVPAPGKQGFFILKSKPAAVSNRSGRPDTADIQHD